MTEQESRFYRDLLTGVVTQVLTDESGELTVSAIADTAGFSRFHLGRVFHRLMAESLEGFVRRIRLERAAYLLRTTDTSVLDVATQQGYSSGEALCRAFKAAYGMSPRRFRQLVDTPWHLASPEGLHWNPKWRTAELIEPPRVVRARVVRRAARRMAVWRILGNYAYLSKSWESFENEIGSSIPRDEGRTYITIYHDNIWTHPDSNTMRADLGWVLLKGEEPPAGMRSVTIPAGPYAVTEDFVIRTNRNDAWSEMSGRYPGKVSYDEYPAWPLPFEQVLTRIVRG